VTDMQAGAQRTSSKPQQPKRFWISAESEVNEWCEAKKRGQSVRKKKKEIDAPFDSGEAPAQARANADLSDV
jgi:hypothetical protein